MIRTQIQIDEHQIKWLKQHALSKGLSMSQVIRDCIDFFRAHEDRYESLHKNRDKALSAVGRFVSKSDK